MPRYVLTLTLPGHALAEALYTLSETLLAGPFPFGEPRTIARREGGEDDDTFVAQLELQEDRQ